MRSLNQSTAGSPNCAQAQLIWQHGNFSQNANGSLTLTPFQGDGRQMVQNGCTEVSSTVSYYNQEEFMQGFNIRLDWHFGTGGYYLQLFGFDGTPKPWLWLKYNPPQMLPTRPLKQVVSIFISSCIALFLADMSHRTGLWFTERAHFCGVGTLRSRTISLNNLSSDRFCTITFRHSLPLHAQELISASVQFPNNVLL